MKKYLLFVFIICGLLNAYGCKSLYFQYLVEVAPDRFEFEENHKDLSLPLYSSRPLGKTDSEIEYLIVMIHGGALNAENALKNGKLMLKALGIPEEKGMVVAPQFLEEDADLDERGLLFWDNRWRGGAYSLSTGVNQGLPKVSSYASLDKLIDYIVRHNPGLCKITILGHSAGGQFVARYAAVNNQHELLGKQGVLVRYVVTNPSSYLYLDKIRYQYESDGKIVETPPEKLLDCPSYNNYKYGLERLYGYAEAVPPPTITSRLLTRPVMFVLGKEDTDRDWGLNTSCEGEAQGRNRFQRGLLYKRHLAGFNNKNPQSSQHIWVEVPNVGHDSTGIFTHPHFIKEIKAFASEKR